MAYKNGQCDTDSEKSDGTAEHFPQQCAVYKTGVRDAGTDESRRKGDDYLYHAPESGCGDKHTVIRREASGQPRALAFHPVGHLPADFLSFLFKRLPR